MFVCFFFSSRRRHTSCALVTGVQTCALPISLYMACWSVIRYQPDFNARYKALREKSKCAKVALIACMRVLLVRLNAMIRDGSERSEERRVGKECVSTCRSRWSQDH